MVTRRTCLKAAAGGAGALAVSPVAISLAHQATSKSARASPAMPGPYRGRVVAVQSPKVLSAGVTLALKNLSHGLVNNVARSHGTRSLNACNLFIPAAVQLPVIRNKTVL